MDHRKVRVFISRKGYVEIPAAPGLTAGEACWTLANRQIIRDAHTFALFHVQVSGEERLISPEEKLNDVKKSWEFEEDNAFMFKRSDAKKEETAVPVLLEDGSMAILYLSDETGSAVSKVLPLVPRIDDDKRAVLSFFEIHLVGGKFLSRQLNSEESVVSVYTSFPDQETSAPTTNALVVKRKDEVVPVFMDNKRLKLTVGPFETVAAVVDRIVADQKLVENKQYQLAEAKSRQEIRVLERWERPYDIASNWEGNHHFVFILPKPSVAVRITLWDGSWKSVGITEKQTVRAVQKSLAEKLHSTTWWKYSLVLLGKATERKLEPEELPLALLNDDPSAKLVCKLDETARESVSFPDKSESEEEEASKKLSAQKDPLLKLPEIYLRARASSGYKETLQLLLPEGAESVSVGVDVSTTVADVFEFISTILPSFSPDIFALEHHTQNSIRRLDNDDLVFSLAIIDKSKLVAVKLPLDLDDITDDDESDDLSDEEQHLVVFYDKESFIEVPVQTDVTARFVCDFIAALLGIKSSAAYSLFETGTGVDRKIDDSERVLTILASWYGLEYRRVFFFRPTTTTENAELLGEVDAEVRRELAESSNSVDDLLDKPKKNKKKVRRIRQSVDSLSRDLFASLGIERRHSGKNQEGLRPKISKLSGPTSLRPLILTRSSQKKSRDSTVSAASSVGSNRLSASEPQQRPLKSSENGRGGRASLRASGTTKRQSSLSASTPATVTSAKASGGLPDIDDVSEKQTPRLRASTPPIVSWSSLTSIPDETVSPGLKDKYDELSAAIDRLEKTPERQRSLVRKASLGAADKSTVVAATTTSSSEATSTGTSSPDKSTPTPPPSGEAKASDDTTNSEDKGKKSRPLSAPVGSLIQGIQRTDSPPSPDLPPKSASPPPGRSPVLKPKARSVKSGSYLKDIESAIARIEAEDKTPAATDSAAAAAEAAPSATLTPSASSESVPADASSPQQAQDECWVLTESDLPTFSDVTTRSLITIYDADMSKVFLKLVEQVKLQVLQLKYFEQHGPALTTAIQTALKGLVTTVKEALLKPALAQAEREKLVDSGQAFAKCICSFFELFIYANDSSMEDNANIHTQNVASAMTLVLQSSSKGDSAAAELLTAQLMQHVSRLSVSLRLRTYLTPSDDKQRLLTRLRLQLKQVAFKFVSQAKPPSDKLEAMKQDVRGIASMLSQIPALIRPEAREQLPDRNVALGRLFKAIKELLALTGKESEHFPKIQSSLQIIIDSCKKCADNGAFPNDAKFLSATNTFIATLRTLAFQAIATLKQKVGALSDPNAVADAQEKLEAIQCSIVVFSVSLPTLANLTVVTPEDVPKLDHMLHDMSSFMLAVIEAIVDSQV